MIEQVLVADDEEIMRDFLLETLKRNNIDAIGVANGKDAVKLVRENSFDLVITDMKMPDLTGIEVLRKIKEISSETIVIIVTAHASIENAVEAMKAGAFHYLVKLFSPDAFLTVLEKAKEHNALVAENRYLRDECAPINSRGSKRIIAESPEMKKILSDVMRIAKSNASVFINGESGTGKEVIAHTIHFQSPRAEKPFIKINCAAVPESLLETEFFGHEKGAFTGATQRRIGRFELAHMGTLLLDEISEIPISVQAKLLRAVQEHEFERIGGNKPIKVDLRFISTSNRNIEEMIENKIFREDLLYRLKVVPIFIPPLRQRKDDILPLSEYFIERMCEENKKERKKLSPEAQKKLLEYPWPGNVRELANIIERAVVMDFSQKIEAQHLFLSEMPGKPLPDSLTLEKLEKNHIIETLQVFQHNKTAAAKALGISPKVLLNKLRQHQIH